MSHYRIAMADTATELQDEVMELMKEGFQPLGGVAVAVAVDRWENERKGGTDSRTDYTFAQAMLRLLP